MLVSQRCLNASPVVLGKARTCSPPSRCHANDQFTSRIACSRLLVQCTPAAIGTLIEPGLEQRPAALRILLVTRQMPRLRQRHQLGVTARLPQIFDVADDRLVAIVERLAETSAAPVGRSSDRDSIAAENRVRRRRSANTSESPGEDFDPPRVDICRTSKSTGRAVDPRGASSHRCGVPALRREFRPNCSTLACTRCFDAVTRFPGRSSRTADAASSACSRGAPGRGSGQLADRCR